MGYYIKFISFIMLTVELDFMKHKEYYFYILIIKIYNL